MTRGNPERLSPPAYLKTTAAVLSYCRLALAVVACVGITGTFLAWILFPAIEQFASEIPLKLLAVLLVGILCFGAWTIIALLWENIAKVDDPFRDRTTLIFSVAITVGSMAYLIGSEVTYISDSVANQIFSAAKLVVVGGLVLSLVSLLSIRCSRVSLDHQQKQEASV